MLVALFKLSKSDGEQLCHDIEQTDGTSTAVAELLDKAGLDGRGAWSALMSLMVAARQLGVDTETLIAGLNQSFKLEEGGDGLTCLLQNATVKRFAKALGLRNEYERIVTDTRVLTDIRPVFNDDKDNPVIQAAIVNHTLRFYYTAGDRGRHESHFALDTADLRKLRTQIDRALKKDKAAQGMAERANIVVLQPIEGEE